uniref:Uncharacterized protein n=1 Tax=Strongyloides stercoralis TaxID=6248 RepID=A0AAF5DIA7_STRER
MIDPEEGCPNCKQFQQNALDAYAIIKRMSTQKNRSAPDLAEVTNLKKLNDEQSQYIINQRKIIERISKEKDELDSSNKHLKIKNEEMNSQYNDLILSLSEVKKKVDETLTELTETKRKYAEVLKKEESFRKSMEQFILCRKMLLSTFSIIKQIKSGQCGDEDKNKNENEDKNKKENENKNKNKNKKVNQNKNVKKNEKEPETIDNDNSDDDLEKIILAEMELSSSSSSSEDEEEREKEESSTKPDIDFVEALLENKEDEKKMIVKTTRSSLPKKTNKSNRAQNKSDEFQEPLLSVEKVINKPKRATNTITGRKTKSVREQISDMDIAKIKEKYKLDMEKMKKNVEAIKMKK